MKKKYSKLFIAIIIVSFLAHKSSFFISELLNLDDVATQSMSISIWLAAGAVFLVSSFCFIIYTFLGK